MSWSILACRSSESGWSLGGVMPVEDERVASRSDQAGEGGASVGGAGGDVLVGRGAGVVVGVAGVGEGVGAAGTADLDGGVGDQPAGAQFVGLHRDRDVVER